jgi:hypothetical protein
MTIDTSRTIEIAYSPWKMLGLLAAGVVLTALSVVIAFELVPGVHARASDFHKLAAYVGMPFFGLCSIIAAWRLATQRGPAVTITPAGIRDVRVAAEPIPWSAVRGISTWQFQRQKIMVLAVDPAVERALTLTAIARSTRAMNARLGADGLCIAATGLKIAYDTLFETACAYAARAHASPS